MNNAQAPIAGFALKVLLLFGISLLVPADLMATHFRYGHLVWTNVGSGATPYKVSFKLFAAFRRDGYSGTASDRRPKIGDIISENIGRTGLNFGDGASTGTLNFYVLNIDAANNWIYTVALAPTFTDPNILLTHTYSGPGPWVANIESCCRISNSVNSGDSNYRVQTTIDYSKTTISPSSTLPIIVQCSALTACSFPVPSSDPDNQLLTYRLATGNESGLTSQPAGLAVNPSTGLANWPAPNNLNGLYSAQIVIEKRVRTNPTVILTTVAVDFLLQVTQSLPQGQPPSFQSPTPTCGQQVTIAPGSSISFTVSAQSNNSGNGVTLNVIGQPPGSTFNPVLPTSGTPSVTSTFSFNPTVAAAGNYQMNFTASDTNGQQTTCGYSIIVPAPNTVVSLSGIRAGSSVRLQAKISGSICSPPVFDLFRRTGGTGSFSAIGTDLVQTAYATILTGPVTTLNEYYVVMKFPNMCAPNSQSNTISFPF